jgi:hypothetical protein
MVKILVDGCTRTAALNLTVGEITGALLTIAMAVLFAMSKHVTKNKQLLVIIMFAVPTLSLVIGQLSRSCDEGLEIADRLTKPELDKPSCVKTDSGFTTVMLTYFVLAALVAVWARGNSSNARIMAAGFFVIAGISWFVGLVFGKDCSTTLNDKQE